MNPPDPSDFRNTLQGIAARNSEGLQLDTRRRIIDSTLHGLQARSDGARRPALTFVPQILAAAAFVFVLLLPAFQLRRNAPLGTGAPIDDLQVTASGSEVVLTWHDGNQPRRVIRATSREELPRLSQAAGERVVGERWVDRQAKDANIVFYLVE